MKSKLIVPFEVKEVGDEGRFTGLASVYGEVDLGGDVVERGAFSKTLSENPIVPVLWQHKSDEVIGSGKLKNTREGLLIEAELDMEDPMAAKAFRKLKRGLMKGLSIGFNAVQDEVKNGVRHLKEVKLWEVSVVTFPMQLGAAVTSVKQMVLSHKADFATELEAADTWAKRYQMISALDTALYTIIWNDSLTDDEKSAKVQESIAQFNEAFMDFLPKFLALMNSRFKSAVESFEKKAHGPDREQIIEARKQEFKALLAGAASSTPGDGAATPSTEPAEYHSALTTLHIPKGLIQ